MRIEQLEYVAAVAEYGSLRRAGRFVHVSQPALSSAIGKLERELGVLILDRHRSGARISAAGLDMLDHITAVLDSVTSLRIAAGDRLAADRTIRVGTVNAGNSTVLLPAVKAFQRAFPGSSVDVRNLHLEELQLALVEGTVELGLVNLLNGDAVPARLTALELLQGRPVAVLPAGHALTQTSSVTAQDLRAEQFIGVRAPHVMHRFARRLFGDQLPPRSHTADGAENVKVMVADGLGVTVLPDYSVAHDPMERAGLIASRSIEGAETPVRLTLQFRRGAQLNPRVQALVDELLHTAAQTPWTATTSSPGARA